MDTINITNITNSQQLSSIILNSQAIRMRLAMISIENNISDQLDMVEQNFQN